MPVLSDIAESILSERYYDRDDDGNIIENWEGLSRRVARYIAAQEVVYGGDPQPYEEMFFDMIYNMDFIPNTPCLMNAGSRGGLNLFSACFVQVPDDSIDSIMQHAWY
jgi:ribonucleoside-diphosphate reductase alpha chain